MTSVLTIIEEKIQVMLNGTRSPDRKVGRPRPLLSCSCPLVDYSHQQSVIAYHSTITKVNTKELNQQSY